MVKQMENKTIFWKQSEVTVLNAIYILEINAQNTIMGLTAFKWEQQTLKLVLIRILTCKPNQH